MNDTREVRFDQWCSKCKYSDITEDNMNPKDPCWDCLHEPMNVDSHKPVNFKTKDVPENATVAGVPAKVLNYNNPGRYVNRRWSICE